MLLILLSHGIKKDFIKLNFIQSKLNLNSWKRDEDGSKTYDDEHSPILQFVAIRRRDTKQWALPGVSCLLNKLK